MNYKIFLYYLVGLAGFYALWWLYQRVASREIRPDELGRVTLRPGLVSWIMGVFSLLLCVLFLTMIFGAAFSGDKKEFLFWFLIGIPMSALMGFSTYIICWARLRVSNDSVEYRGLNGWETFKWVNVICVDAHSELGPRLKVQNKRKMYFWPYGYGLKETSEFFINNNKPFRIA